MIEKKSNEVFLDSENYEILFKNVLAQKVGPRFFCYQQSLVAIYVNNRSSLNADPLNKTVSDGHYKVDAEYLKSLDPKEWKDQDHYAVLGLQIKRFAASDDEIRQAFRKIVLNHHPDKRKAKGEEVATDDDYFSCITKAYEILGSPKSRRSYDSIDPKFDDAYPTTADIEKNFYKAFNKYFALNARWSERKNVPLLGDETSTRNNVEIFYNFWYDFESWREFSYFDEEDKEKGQDREERRWIEKQNKIARIKRKKEEMSRIRALVDLAYINDPRILKFKQEEKRKKLNAKQAKMSAVKAAKAKEEYVVKEALLSKERAELLEQKRIEQIRIQKEQNKKLHKKEKKLLRDKLKINNYFSSNEKEKLYHMEGVEKICESLNMIDLQNFNQDIQNFGKIAFSKILNQIEAKMEHERDGITKIMSNTDNNKTMQLDQQIWNIENVQLLIKSVNLFPAGTPQRWEVISKYLNEHSSHKRFQPRDVLGKANDLKDTEFARNFLKNVANESAFEAFEKNKKELKKVLNTDISCESKNYSEEKISKIKQKPVESLLRSNLKEGTGGRPRNPCVEKNQEPPIKWTPEEQAILEQAIKTYPISAAQRWDRIAECLPNRSKKDCLKRVKELVDRVNAKKEALLACK